MGVIRFVPLNRREARRFVAEHHRHNEPAHAYKFAIGLEQDGDLIGVVVANEPSARLLNDGRTIELLRVTTLGDKNACSRLYGAACRAAAAMGYDRVITYTLSDEPGVSLRASGFAADGLTEGGSWLRDGRTAALYERRLFDEPKMPQGPKQRWVRVFSPPSAVQDESGEAA